MITMTLVRQQKISNALGLFGCLYLDGVQFCYTLENRAKAIPVGKYDCRVTPSYRVLEGELWSPRSGVLPEILEVPERTGIRFHAGNSWSETTGCVLVGAERHVTPEGMVTLQDSRLALRRLMESWPPDTQRLLIVLQLPDDS